MVKGRWPHRPRKIQVCRPWAAIDQLDNWVGISEQDLRPMVSHEMWDDVGMLMGFQLQFLGDSGCCLKMFDLRSCLQIERLERWRGRVGS